MKLDAPDFFGNYQYPAGSLDFRQFVDASDDAQGVVTHATGTVTTRVHVQVHNRGLLPANGVRVMLLLAKATAVPLPLPAAYAASVQTGTPIHAGGWDTLGIAMLDDLRAGFPKIASFDLQYLGVPPDLRIK